jgi:hypothetical protein
MDDISLALNPPTYGSRRTPPIRISRARSRVWPLASINGRVPVVLDNAKLARGIELAFPRVDATDAIESCPIGSPNGTATHVMPAMTAALSIGDGAITFAGRIWNGFGIIIDHGDGWASHYANLDAIAAIRTDLYRPRSQHVRTGDVIGYVGAPAAGELKRLYFELWQRDHDGHFVPADPRTHLDDWTLVQRSDPFTPAPPAVKQKAA